ncbi:UNVERIFIED_CONTAM: hypothetical protein RMT77_010099 [Armadillidium vulgare]
MAVVFANRNDFTATEMFNPNSLYTSCIGAISKSYKYLNSEFYIYPPDIHFDILHGLYVNRKYNSLTKEVSKLENLCKFLRASSKRVLFHKIFQTAMNHAYDTHVYPRTPSNIIVEEFIEHCMIVTSSNKFSEKLVNQGLTSSTFLSEGGWLKDAETILLYLKDMLLASNYEMHMKHLIECYQKLLHVQNGFCEFRIAEKTYREALELISSLQETKSCPNLALLYSEFSTLFILLSNYEQAHQWSVQSLLQLRPNLGPVAAVDVYRQAAKVFVLKREFKKAGFLIKEACKIARAILKEQTLKYSDTLIDFGLYLLNVDEIHRGIEVYEMALQARQSVFGSNSKNLYIATAHEDLAYASYVFNYTNGFFQDARSHVEKALSILLCLLPKDHLLFSSCKRIKALILEEMALENTDKIMQTRYLDEAHSLHTEALQLALEAFGEMNVQTAKHYGNLGRLYQSMKKYQSAEEMHLKSIAIKEALLGPDDHEVALSLGHLASLYNYDLCYYSKAEMLHLRSIRIGKKLFGEAYSGLEYDYRGLLRVYTFQHDIEKRFRYMNILSCWKSLRERLENSTESPFEEVEEINKIDFVVQKVMDLYFQKNPTYS